MGNDITDPLEIRDLIYTFFTTLYTSQKDSSPRLVPLPSNKINIHHLPSKDEVRQSLFSMHPNKAPGPDGYHPGFFQAMWDVVGEDIFQTIRGWFQEGRVPESLCEALICLIPKQNPPELVKQLRPISLCNTMYKILTKTLVNRLKPFMPNLISQTQNSFTKGRGPDVNLVVASEVLHSMWKKKGNKGWFALKLT